MICQFCKKEKKLCRAHIIPVSFYRFMYPNGKIEGDSLILIADNKEFVKKRRIGLYDRTILCEECDGKLGKYDQYGKSVFLDIEPTLIKVIESGNAFLFQDVDPKNLKLFILSIIWRASISNLPEFKSVKFSTKFEEEIREMLIAGNVGGLNDFSVVISRFGYLNFDKELRQYLQMPLAELVNGVNYYKLYLPNGYIILIKNDENPQITPLVPLTLDVKKPIYVIQYEYFEESREFKKLIENEYKIKPHSNLR